MTTDKVYVHAQAHGNADTYGYGMTITFRTFVIRGSLRIIMFAISMQGG